MFSSPTILKKYKSKLASMINIIIKILHKIQIYRCIQLLPADVNMYVCMYASGLRGYPWPLRNYSNNRNRILMRKKILHNMASIGSTFTWRRPRKCKILNVWPHLRKQESKTKLKYLQFSKYLLLVTTTCHLLQCNNLKHEDKHGNIEWPSMNSNILDKVWNSSY